MQVLRIWATPPSSTTLCRFWLVRFFPVVLKTRDTRSASCRRCAPRRAWAELQCQNAIFVHNDASCACLCSVDTRAGHAPALCIQHCDSKCCLAIVQLGPRPFSHPRACRAFRRATRRAATRGAVRRVCATAARLQRALSTSPRAAATSAARGGARRRGRAERYSSARAPFSVAPTVVAQQQQRAS